ncbi:MAG: hypothetical protein V4724_39480 [Pseudomonadota bacterium]
MAETPETSDYTSIQERLEMSPALPAVVEDAPEAPLPQAPLMPFDATGRTAWAIPFAFDEHLELVDWTGRAVHPGKKGYIAAGLPKILTRIRDGAAFIAIAGRLLREFGSAVRAAPD